MMFDVRMLRESLEVQIELQVCSSLLYRMEHPRWQCHSSLEVPLSIERVEDVQMY